MVTDGDGVGLAADHVGAAEDHHSEGELRRVGEDGVAVFIGQRDGGTRRRIATESESRPCPFWLKVCAIPKAPVPIKVPPVMIPLVS